MKILSELETTIKIISSYDPIIALDLKILLDDSFFFKNILPNDSEQNIKSNITLMSKFTEKFHLIINEQVKKILWRYDKLFLLKYYLRNKKNNKTVVNWNDIFEE